MILIKCDVNAYINPDKKRKLETILQYEKIKSLKHHTKLYKVLIRWKKPKKIPRIQMRTKKKKKGLFEISVQKIKVFFFFLP